MASVSDSVTGNSNIPTEQVTYLAMYSALMVLLMFATLSSFEVPLLIYKSFLSILLSIQLSLICE